jgi:hypothetical protein
MAAPGAFAQGVSLAQGFPAASFRARKTFRKTRIIQLIPALIFKGNPLDTLI